MTLRVVVDPRPGVVTFEREHVVRVGRSRSADVRVGHQRIGDRWTVSSEHAELRWDGTRWATRNVSTRTGLLHVYEPGYEEVPLEPGRPWVPVRHRWALAFGPPDHRTVVVCTTDDHRGPGLGVTPDEPGAGPPGDGTLDGTPGDGPADPLDAEDVPDPTMSLDDVIAVPLTALERDVLLAYYSDFGLLPRPPVLAPRSHDEAARRLGRSRDSTRKAIERVNEKVARAPGAPAAATGRNVSSEIGAWLARTGLVDPL